MNPAKQDRQTTTPTGEPLIEEIAGVKIRSAHTLADDRGTLCEVFNPAWGFDAAPLTFVYQFTILPGKIKGWQSHRLHDDRVFISRGTVKVVLYDDRPESPTYRKISEMVQSHFDRTLMIVPAFVFHAYQNIGNEEALFINMPSQPYDHLSPDVYRLPIDTDYIPYKFETKIGW